jgi:hypothetical protein
MHLSGFALRLKCQRILEILLYMYMPGSDMVLFCMYEKFMNSRMYYDAPVPRVIMDF